ncbi:hypothetical protein OM076_41325, partial [Solirubrobacter ginsenosidimutans]
MTVDERLRAAHARIPDPDEDRIARARAALTAAMALQEGDDAAAARRPGEPGHGDADPRRARRSERARSGHADPRLA